MPVYRFLKVFLVQDKKAGTQHAASEKKGNHKLSVAGVPA